jgi:hypothetical protein
MSQIVDDSPEMELDDPRIQEVLNAKDGVKPQPKPDVKPAEPVSSAAPKTEDEPVDEKDKVIKGLQAELARRKGNSEKLEALEAELKELKTERTQPKNEFAWIQKLDDDALASKQTDWDDELADARAKYSRAEETGDERALERQGQRILAAKRTLSAFRKEILDRGSRRQNEKEAAQREYSTVQSEIESMHSAVQEQFEDFMNPETELWKAGNEEFNAHPALMARLGPLGEVVAAALAVVKHPELVAKKGTASARKEVIGKLEKSVKHALSTGASAPSTNQPVNYDVSSADGLAAFNAMIDKFKGG